MVIKLFLLIILFISGCSSASSASFAALNPQPLLQLCILSLSCTFAAEGKALLISTETISQAHLLCFFPPRQRWGPWKYFFKATFTCTVAKEILALPTSAELVSRCSIR